MNATIRLSFDTKEVESMLEELNALIQRRGSLPEFAQRFRDIPDLLSDGFETVRVGLDLGPAGAGEVLFALKIREPLLECLAALRAFDRDFDLAGQVHGHSFHDGV